MCSDTLLNMTRCLHYVPSLSEQEAQMFFEFCQRKKNEHQHESKRASYEKQSQSGPRSHFQLFQSLFSLFPYPCQGD